MSVDQQEDNIQLTPYQAAGELVGITRLVDEFYANMDSLPEAKVIRNMHPPDLTESRKKLTYFLCGWLGAETLSATLWAHQHSWSPQTVPDRVRGT